MRTPAVQTPTAEQLRESSSRRCRHFTGARSETCAAGVRYTDLVPRGPNWMSKLPCLESWFSTPCGVTCASHAYRMPEEIAADEAETQRRLECADRGASHCCGAPLDLSRVPTRGPWKGTGWRHCSNCERELFHQIESMPPY